MTLLRIDTVSALLLFAGVATALVALDVMPRERSVGQSDGRIVDANLESAGTQAEQDIIADPRSPVPADSMDETLARPLFSPNRRPSADSPPEVATVAPNLRPNSRAAARLRLVGVVMADDVKFALLHDAQTGKTTRLEAGEEFDGWELDSLDAGTVILKRGAESNRLVLERKSDARAAALTKRRRAKGSVVQALDASPVRPEEPSGDAKATAPGDVGTPGSPEKADNRSENEEH
jgi:hypothetical protein